MSILKLQVITSLFVVLFSGHVLADAVCDECMDQKAKDQTISLNSSVNDVIAVAGKVDPFKDERLMAKLCQSLRNVKDSLVNPAFYDFEYQMLRLSGVSDEQLSTASNEELSAAVGQMWKQHHKELECKSESHIYPMGNYFRQLAAINAKRPFLLLLRTYKLDPNVIDADGCTALDYLEVQISRTSDFTEAVIQKFIVYRDLMLKAGAKTAKQLGGKC